MVLELEVGRTYTWSRAITEDDVRRFAELSGDKGAHHMQPDAAGRLMAHGLLTAALPTKLGGDFNYIARRMVFEFLRPVYSGDVLTCLGTVEAAVEQPRRWNVEFSFVVSNQNTKVVLKGTTSGIIHKAAA